MAPQVVTTAPQEKQFLNVVWCLAINTFVYEYKCLLYASMFQAFDMCDFQ